MASDKAITAAILETVRKLFKTDLDALSVNNVRKVVEGQLDLSAGFLKSDAWKAKSKELITGEVAKLDGGTAPESSAPTPEPKPKSAPEPKVAKKPEPVKKGTKRAAPAKAAAPKKRQKKEVTPSSSDEELSEPEESEEEASFSDSDVSEAPKPKKRAGGARGKKGKIESESEEESEAEETPSEVDSDVSEAPKKKTAKPKAKAPPKRASTASRKSSEKVVSEDEDEEAASPVKPNPVVVARSKPVPTVEKPDVEDDEKPDTSNQAAEDSESDLSVLIDEPPKRAKSSSKSAKPSTSKTPKPAAAISPADAEIKTLRSQLVKCGIRKIWQFELKDYGDDSKAKIRHLKGMLKEVGMEGRFSEARAREIKEMRELAQDVEAVTEGAKLWGKRGRRSEGKKAVSQEAGSESEEESEEEIKPAGRAARKADLAFLGDESESD
ncbi:hypothetical protein V496_10048 [Pseudogymnoascus sp. VKM F-4515 (FW-2607)]|nr:hypothetical protein V496_10048 [Pseudogymnoascus sp. VKM F-4515 (FW-2607)]KFY90350.1 hypothetical protein V498_06021 [Pseudogymnoascus sp. VKM F-4517 (FW-2822)]